MKRREVPGGVRFITFSCERRLPLLGTPRARDLFARSLREARERLGFALLAWAAMPEHVHLLLVPSGGEPLAPALKSLKLSSQQRVLRFLRESGDPHAAQIIRADGTPRFWQKGGGFDRNVRDDGELQKEVRYTHRNPVERGLAATPLDWPWSSARFWAARHSARPSNPTLLPPVPEPAPGDVACDWPPGDPRGWAMWAGFL